jgi:glycerophosphoryl diester phosphodiesterase
VGAWPFLDHPGPLAFAHRGGACEWPENTLRAFAHAVDLGYRYLETDTHMTRDGVLLAFHDHALDRVTDGSGLIADLPWSEVREARVDGREPIPTLEELLTEWPDVRVNVDAKHDAAVEPLADLIERLDVLDRVCVGSFSDRRLSRLRARLGPDLCWSYGPRGILRVRLGSLGIPAGDLGAACAQVPVSQKGIRIVDRRFVRFLHARGQQVHVWTIDDADEMHRLLDLGVDGIMTDRPQVLKAVLEERGAWVS